MRPPIHEHRRFFACSSRPLSAVGSSPLAAMVMLMLFPFVTSAVGDVVVTKSVLRPESTFVGYVVVLIGCTPFVVCAHLA